MLHHSHERYVDSSAWGSLAWWRAWTAPELRIVLCPDSMTVVTLSAARPGRPARHLQQHSVLAQTPVGTGGPGEAYWQQLSALLAQYSKHTWHVVVVLSSQFARPLLLPWQSAIVSQQEFAAYARFQRSQHLGSAAADWPEWSTPRRYGQPTLSTALSLEMHTALQACFKAAGVPLHAVYPAWILALNQASAHIPHSVGEAWLLSREHSCLVLARYSRRQWLGVYYAPVEHDWQTSAQRLFSRATLLHGDEAAVAGYVSCVQTPADLRQLSTLTGTLWTSFSGEATASDTQSGDMLTEAL